MNLNHQNDTGSSSAGIEVAGTETWVPRKTDPLLKPYEPCTFEVPHDAAWMTCDGRARISGSEHGRWIIERACAAFCEIHPQIAFDIDLRGTPSAMAFLMNGQAMFSVMGREITPVETVPYTKLIGAPAMAVRVAHTAEETSQHLATSLAVYVHRDNPLERLDRTQISKIFSIGNPSGDYSRWSQLGLHGQWSNRLIHPIGTPEFTGFGTYMQAHLLNGRPLSPLYEHYVGTGAVLGRLAQDRAGVAVAALGCETADIRQVPVSMNPQAPTSLGSTGDVRSNSYLFGRFLYFYVPQKPSMPLDPVLREYLRFVLSAEGQAIIAAQPGGYIPLSQEEAAVERAKLDRVLVQEGN
ncbi:PstS family phosphate ABC transporter substrate-binding protein [Roseibium limicola]